MKIPFALLLLLLVFCLSFLMIDKNIRPAEVLNKNITLCSPSTGQFAGFGSDLSFVYKHENPIPFVNFQAKGSMVTFPVKNGENANAYFVPSATPTNDYLIVIHEWWGLNNYIKNESDRLAKELGNINVLALDLYDGNVAETREKAREYMQAVTNERAYAMISGANNFIGEDAQVFTIGWCFGGGWSLQTAIELGDKVKGAIMFYGMPETDIKRLSKLKADVLGIFAANEKWINTEVVAQFEVDMEKVNPSLKVKSYAAEHGFANPSNPRYDQTAAKDAFKNVMEFIAARR